MCIFKTRAQVVFEEKKGGKKREKKNLKIETLKMEATFFHKKNSKFEEREKNNFYSRARARTRTKHEQRARRGEHTRGSRARTHAFFVFLYIR